MESSAASNGNGKRERGERGSRGSKRAKKRAVEDERNATRVPAPVAQSKASEPPVSPLQHPFEAPDGVGLGFNYWVAGPVPGQILASDLQDLLVDLLGSDTAGNAALALPPWLRPGGFAARRVVVACATGLDMGSAGKHLQAEQGSAPFLRRCSAVPTRHAAAHEPLGGGRPEDARACAASLLWRESSPLPASQLTSLSVLQLFAGCVLQFECSYGKDWTARMVFHSENDGHEEGADGARSQGPPPPQHNSKASSSAGLDEQRGPLVCRGYCKRVHSGERMPWRLHLDVQEDGAEAFTLCLQMPKEKVVAVLTRNAEAERGGTCQWVFSGKTQPLTTAQHSGKGAAQPQTDVVLRLQQAVRDTAAAAKVVPRTELNVCHGGGGSGSSSGGSGSSSGGGSGSGGDSVLAGMYSGAAASGAAVDHDTEGRDSHGAQGKRDQALRVDLAVLDPARYAMDEEERKRKGLPLKLSAEDGGYFSCPQASAVAAPNLKLNTQQAPPPLEDGEVVGIEAQQQQQQHSASSAAAPPLERLLPSHGCQAYLEGRGYKLLGLDCEMVYTEKGLELARAVVVNARGESVYDRLVKPRLPVRDYNTAYSGITKEQLEGVSTTLAQVQVDIARFVDSNTYLVGHSLEGDLRALRLVHKRLIDTSSLYPHNLGCPFRLGLKVLCKKVLGKTVQEGSGSSGHDPIQDARMAVDLALAKMQRGADYGLPAAWAGERSPPREPVFAALRRVRPHVKCAVVGDFEAAISADFPDGAPLWVRYELGYRREADAVWTARHFSGQFGNAEGAARMEAYARSSARDILETAVRLLHPQPSGNAAADGAPHLPLPGNGHAVAAAFTEQHEEEDALESGTASSGATAPAAPPDLLWVDFPCTFAEDAQERTGANGAAQGGGDVKRWRSLAEVDRAAAALYAAMPAGTLLLVVCQHSMALMRRLMEARLKSKWETRGQAKKLAVAGRPAAAPWHDLEEKLLGEEAKRVLQGLTFLAVK